MKIRKLVTWLEETLTEMDRDISPPIRRAVAVAVLKNPFAGLYQPDLTRLITAGEALGAMLTQKALAVLGCPAEAYGKAAIVGEAGELEHAAALLHPKLGTPAVPRSSHPPRNAPAWGPPSISRWATRTPPSCVAISTPSKRGSPTRRWPMRSSCAWRWRPAGGRFRGSVGSAWGRSRAATGCGEFFRAAPQHRGMIGFTLNGAPVRTAARPTTTLLD